MKKLIKNEICGSVNSASMNSSRTPPKTRENKKKKKRKKEQNAAFINATQLKCYPN